MSELITKKSDDGTVKVYRAERTECFEIEDGIILNLAPNESMRSGALHPDRVNAVAIFFGFKDEGYRFFQAGAEEFSKALEIAVKEGSINALNELPHNDVDRL